MQDRPSAVELLEAIERFLRGRSEAAEDRWLRFQLLVCANSLGIVRRELGSEEGALRSEWAALDGLVGARPLPETFAALGEGMTERHEELCRRIRAGDFDAPEQENALLEYLVAETKDRVRVTAPAEAGG